MAEFANLIVFLILLVTGYIVGTILEKRHYKSIEKRETESINLPATNLEILFPGRHDNLGLVAGNVVISVDYFKRFIAGLRNLLGGRHSSYESLLDRARREAVLRMKEQCPPGTTAIMNMRIETAAVGSQHIGRRNGVACLEVCAYGTAIRTRQSA